MTTTPDPSPDAPRPRPAADRKGVEPARFWTGMALVLFWGGLGVWLDTSAIWPNAATCYHSGGGYNGLFNQMHCSRALLTGGWREIALFGYLWTLPLVVLGCILWARRGR